MKRMLLVLLTALLIVLCGTTAFAENGKIGWVKDEQGDWYYYFAEDLNYKAPMSGVTAFREIDGLEYAFDADGKMLWGWVDEYSTRCTGAEGWKDATYYLGGKDDGHRRKTEWEQIRVLDYEQDDEYQNYWFYFTSLGRKLVNTGSGNFLEKTIKNAKYAFADDGHMLSGFVDATSDGTVSADGYKFFSSPESGKRKTRGWFKVLTCEELDQAGYDADEYSWYYAKGDGSLACNEMLTVKGKKYLFNESGEMVTGVTALCVIGDVVQIVASDIETREEIEGYRDSETGVYGDDVTSLYYFGSNGAMKTGSASVKLGGETLKLKFDEDGHLIEVK